MILVSRTLANLVGLILSSVRILIEAEELLVYGDSREAVGRALRCVGSNQIAILFECNFDELTTGTNACFLKQLLDCSLYGALRCLQMVGDLLVG